MSFSLDRTMNSVENFLTDYACVPIVPGAIKIGLGAIQSAVAGVIGVLTLPAVACGKKKVNLYAWTHVLHGFGNIVAGVAEATPILGCVIVCARKSRLLAASDYLVSYKDSSDGKCQPYKSLVADNITFYGGDQGTVRSSQQKFDIWSVGLSPTQRIQLAEDLIEGKV